MAKEKLTDDQVRKIRTLLVEGKLSQRAIADRFGVTQSTIRDIKCGRIWKVDGPQLGGGVNGN